MRRANVVYLRAESRSPTPMTAARHVVALDRASGPCPRCAARQRRVLSSSCPRTTRRRGLPRAGRLARVVPAAVPGAPVVDDGSRDGTWRVAESQGAAWLRFDARPRRRGGDGGGLSLRGTARLRGRRARWTATASTPRATPRPSWSSWRQGPQTWCSDCVHALGRPRDGALARRGAQALLAHLLSWITGERVTDPTCGCAAFGPRAVGCSPTTTRPAIPSRSSICCSAAVACASSSTRSRRARGQPGTPRSPRRISGAPRRVSALAMVVVPLRDHQADVPRA